MVRKHVIHKNLYEVYFQKIEHFLVIIGIIYSSTTQGNQANHDDY